MKTSQEIRALFEQFPLWIQGELLEDLLIEQELKSWVLQEALEEEVLKRNKKSYPHCCNTNVYKRGKQNNVKIYRCNDCEKWYSETTSTSLYEIKLKSKWQSYLRCMQKGMSIKKIAKELNISIQTSFDLRHKILSSLEQFTSTELSEEVECDELELALSCKGSKSLERKPRKRETDFKRNQQSGKVTTVQVVTAVQRNGQKYLKAVASKRLSKEQLTKALDDKLIENTTFITDKYPSYKAFAKNHPSIKHKALLTKDYVDKNDNTIHLQKANQVHSKLRRFLQPFNGVSSKYLQNYLNWYAYADKIKNSKTIIK